MKDIYIARVDGDWVRLSLDGSRVFHKWLQSTVLCCRHWIKRIPGATRAGAEPLTARIDDNERYLSAQRKLRNAIAVKAARLWSSLSLRLCTSTSFVNISVIRGHYPSFNGNARSALINYYELFERRIVGHAARAECLFFRASREYLHVRYPLVYIRFIFVPRIYAREFIRSSMPFNSLYSFWNVYTYVYTYEYKTRYCFARILTLQCSMLSRNVHSH